MNWTGKADDPGVRHTELAARRLRVIRGIPVRNMTDAEAREALYGAHTRSGRVDRVVARG